MWLLTQLVVHLGERIPSANVIPYHKLNVYFSRKYAAMSSSSLVAEFKKGHYEFMLQL